MRFSVLAGTAVALLLLAGSLVSPGQAVAWESPTAGGARWVRVGSPTTIDLHGVDMAGADHGWAVGAAGMMIEYEEGHWREVERPTRDFLVDVDLSSDQDGWAVGTDAILQLKGGVWGPYPHPSPIFPEAIGTVGADDAWVLEGTRVLRFSNGEWQLPVALDGAKRMMDLAMLSTDAGWAVGFDGVILQYNGEDWRAVPSPTSGRLTAVSFADPGNGWAVGGVYPRFERSQGMILHYSGATWDVLDVPGVPFLSDVSATPDGGAWAISNEGAAVRLHPDGSWQAVAIPRGATSLSMVSTTDGWAVGEEGLILRYTAMELPVAPAPPAAEPDPNRVYFSETGHFISSGFLHFWRSNGGLVIFGYPITEEFSEQNPPPPAGDGKTYTVQYFERARFEYHPESKGTTYEVELGLLGRNVTAGRVDDPFRAFFSAQYPPPADTPVRRYFGPQSYFDLAYGFKSFWERNGGLAVFGYPISHQFVEASPEDGKSYVVQYFERARFEWHPELRGTPFEVQLGLLGKQMLRDRGWLP